MGFARCLLFSLLEAGVFWGIIYLIIILPFILIFKLDVDREEGTFFTAVFISIMFILFTIHNIYFVVEKKNFHHMTLENYFEFNYFGVNINFNKSIDDTIKYFKTKEIENNINSFLEEFSPAQKEKIDKIDKIITNTEDKIERLNELKLEISSRNNQYIIDKIKKYEQLNSQLKRKYKKIYENLETAYVKNESRKIEKGQKYHLSIEISNLIDNTLIEAENISKILADENLK